MDRLLLKHKSAAKFVPAPVIEKKKHAGIGLITIGGCDPAVREAIDILAEEGMPCDYMRIRAFPFNDDVERFIMEHNMCFVIEQNRDAQLKSLLTLETHVPKEKLQSILVYGGFPLSAKNVVDGLRHHGVREIAPRAKGVKLVQE
jgi:2-oxoglutarate ferredoxin oxidoreductase subunit alpha